MKRRVVWARHALDELTEIATFIAAENPSAARKVAAMIRSTGANLGKLATGRMGRADGTYEKLVPRLPDIIAYEFEKLPDGGEAVVILHVIHGTRDWPDELS